MFRIRLLTFCTVPHAAQFAPTICANLRWQPWQLLRVGPDAISLIVSGGMSTISKRLEAVSFWRKTSSSRRMRSTSTRAGASSEVLMNSKPRKATRGTSLPSGPAFAPPPAMMARKIPNAAFMAEGHSRARASLILAVKSFARNEGAESGVHMLRVFDRLGITEQMEAKTKAMPVNTGYVAGLVVRGETEMAAQQMPELIAVPGVKVTPLPPEFQLIIVFSAGVSAGSTEPGAVNALLNFLTSQEAAAVLTAKGLNPA